jgi:hypothetical protein
LTLVVNTREGLGGAGAGLAIVGDFVVQSVGPNGNFGWGHSDGAVVDEAKVLQHFELGVAAGLEEGGPHSGDVAARNVGKDAQNFSHADHFSHPLLVTLVLQILLQSKGIG